MHPSDSTPYMRLIGKFKARKDSLGADAWGASDKNIRNVMAPIEDLMAKEFPTFDPYPRGAKREAALLVRNILFSEALVPEYCNLFKGLSDEQLLSVAQSFNYNNYVKRTRLEAILSGKEKAEIVKPVP
jgi:endoglucanase